MATTRFILARHAHTDAVGRVLAGRAPGHGLNAAGMEEAVRLALSLSAEAIAAVFSSPRLRARQTAEHIANATGCIVEESAGLDEVDFGGWSGRDFTDLDEAPGWAEWNALRSLAPTPGGETMLQVQARAVAVLQRLHTQRNGCAFVLVSHADVIRSVLAYALGMPIDLMQRIDIFPASRSVILLGDSSVLVHAVNLPHP